MQSRFKFCMGEGSWARGQMGDEWLWVDNWSWMNWSMGADCIGLMTTAQLMTFHHIGSWKVALILDSDFFGQHNDFSLQHSLDKFTTSKCYFNIMASSKNILINLVNSDLVKEYHMVQIWIACHVWMNPNCFALHEYVKKELARQCHYWLLSLFFACALCLTFLFFFSFPLQSLFSIL